MSKFRINENKVSSLKAIKQFVNTFLIASQNVQRVIYPDECCEILIKILIKVSPKSLKRFFLNNVLCTSLLKCLKEKINSFSFTFFYVFT